MPLNFHIIESRKFNKLVKKYSRKHPSIINDIEIAKRILSKEPDIMSDYIPGYGGKVGKFRMPISGSKKGKSGGARIIFLKDDTKRVIYLLFIYLKSELSNISSKEIDILLKEIEAKYHTEHRD